MARVQVSTATERGIGNADVAPLRAPQLPAGATPAAFGGQAAEAWGDIARAGSRAAVQIQEIGFDVARRDAVIRARTDGMRHRVEWIKRLEERRQAAEPGADGFTDAVMKEYADWRGKVLEEAAANPIYRREVEDDLLQFEGSLFQDATRFEAQAKREHAQTQLAGFLDTAQEAVLMRPESLGEVGRSFEAMVDASALSATDKEKLKLTGKAALAGFHWQARGMKDPRGTLAALQAGADGMGLEAGDRLKLMNALEADVRREEAQARAEAREREHEARRAQAEAKAAAAEQQAVARVEIEARLEEENALRAAGQPVASPVTDEEIMAAWGPKAGPRALARFRTQRDANEALGSVVGLGAEDQERVLLESVPDPAKPDFAGQTAAYELIRKAVDADRRQREADPAGYVMRHSKAVRAAFQATENDPQAIKKAVALSIEEQRRLGVPEERIAPLPEPQMQRMAAEIAREPDPAVKVERLAELAGLTSDEAMRRRMFAGLEKAGFPKGTSAAVEAVQRGDRAGAVAIMTGATADVKLPGETGREVRERVDQAALEHGAARIGALATQWTGNAGYIGAIRQSLDVAEQTAAAKVAAGIDAKTAAREATAAVLGDETTIADPNLAAVTLPKSADPDAVRAGMVSLRDGIANLTNFEAVWRMIDPEGKGGALGVKVAQQTLEDWSDEGRWVNDGDGFALLVPVRTSAGGSIMRRLLGPDGNPLRWSVEDLIAAAAGSTAQAPAASFTSAPAGALPGGLVLK